MESWLREKKKRITESSEGLLGCSLECVWRGPDSTRIHAFYNHAFSSECLSRPKHLVISSNQCVTKSSHLCLNRPHNTTPLTLQLWPIDKVVDEFLVPIGLADLGSIFKENNITGDVLLVGLAVCTSTLFLPSHPARIFFFFLFLHSARSLSLSRSLACLQSILQSLDKRDLKDMKIANVGDRLYIDQCLDNLRKHYHR